MQHRDHQSDDAEHRILEQIGRKRSHLADHGLQAGVAGERYRRELDREIAQIERIADGDEADDQQELDLVRREPEGDFFHARNMAGIVGPNKPDFMA